MEFVAVRRNVRTDESVDLDGLVGAKQRNQNKAQRLARVILLVFRLLHRCRQERGDGQRLLAIDLTVAAGPRNAMRDGVRPQMDAARVAQRLNPAVVRNRVAELDDLRHAPEMFDKASHAAERLARQIVEGNLPVVEIRVRNSAQVLENEVLDHAQILPDRRWAYLLVVADDKHGLAQVQSHQRHHVTLAGFIDDDNVEARSARIKIFHHARKRHDPNGNRPAALAHLSSRFGAQKGNTDSVPFADATNGVEPAHKRLALSTHVAAPLRSPIALLAALPPRSPYT